MRADEHVDRYRHFMEARVAEDPRTAVGGIWQEMGDWQLDVLEGLGLKPTHSLLDLGCGSFRGGRRLIPYLNEGRYVGADISPDAMEAGLRFLGVEGVRTDFERHVTNGVDLSAIVGPFDFILAQSVFSHTPPSVAEPLFAAAAGLLGPAGVFVLTYFQGEERYDFETENAFYPAGWFESLGARTGVRVETFDRGHPRGQTVLVARRDS